MRDRGDLASMSKKRLWALAKILAIVLVSVVGSHATPILAEDAADSSSNIPPASAENTKDLKEILWLARAVYSESKLSQDQRLVACTVRNRVESGKWGDAYQEVVLSPYQFSGLHPYSWNAQYSQNITRTYASAGSAWKSALDVSKKVYYAKDVTSVCPELPSTATHFFSPQAMVTIPAWAHQKKLVYSAGNRFSFYADVD